MAHMEIWVSTPDLGVFTSQAPAENSAPQASFQHFRFDDLTPSPVVPLWLDPSCDPGTEVLGNSEAGSAAMKLEITWDDEEARQRYRRLFESLHSQLSSSTGPQKLVGSVGFEGQLANIEELWPLLTRFFKAKLQQTQSRFFQHLIATPQTLQVGCSPELLFRKSAAASKISTVALAGTAPTDRAQTLSHDPKELKEHEWVIQSLKEQSRNWAELSFSDPLVVDLGNGLSHLKSQVDLSPTWIKPPDDLAHFLIEKLHPTAALGSFPPKAIELHRLYSGAEDRRHFGAPMLLQTNEGDLESWVNIRSFEIKRNGRIFFPVGAGLVQESTFESEWQELLRKRSSLLNTLGISENLTTTYAKDCAL